MRSHVDKKREPEPELCHRRVRSLADIAMKAAVWLSLEVMIHSCWYNGMIISWSKYEPIVIKIDLIRATSCYAHVRFQKRRDTTFAIVDTDQIVHGNLLSKEPNLDSVNSKAIECRITVDQCAFYVFKSTKYNLMAGKQTIGRQNRLHTVTYYKEHNSNKCNS